jgi:sterol desaturase/sphingolipid hydroxylase (fatty acid hydroxylase superfamily)
MIGIPLALAYQNMGEWLVHKHMLHGRGKKRENFWAFHFFEHHRAARTHDMVDADYLKPLGAWNAQGKEAAALLGVTLLHLPLLPVAPFFTLTFAWANLRYYRVHKKAHLDTAWGREHIPWHYDHHMGLNQEANWCVSKPWADRWMGTRIPYAGTEREAKDQARRAKVAQGPTPSSPAVASPTATSSVPCAA